jgi:hypothetical protein
LQDDNVSVEGYQEINQESNGQQDEESEAKVLYKVVAAMEVCEAHEQVQVEGHRQFVEDGHSLLP